MGYPYYEPIHEMPLPGSSESGDKYSWPFMSASSWPSYHHYLNSTAAEYSNSMEVAHNNNSQSLIAHTCYLANCNSNNVSSSRDSAFIENTQQSTSKSYPHLYPAQSMEVSSLSNGAYTGQDHPNAIQEYSTTVLASLPASGLKIADQSHTGSYPSTNQQTINEEETAYYGPYHALPSLSAQNAESNATTSLNRSEALVQLSPAFLSSAVASATGFIFSEVANTLFG